MTEPPTPPPGPPTNGATGTTEGSPLNGTPAGPAATEGADPALRAAVLELERYAAAEGWDRPARLFALVLTADLVANEPSLAEMLDLPPDADLTGSLTPVEQEEVPEDMHVEELLTELTWPAAVHGAAVSVERLVLPPSVELPEDDDEAMRVAQSHPDRQEVRMVVAATRTGATYCAMRLRSHDEDESVLEGPELVPALLELVQGTLAAVGPDVELLEGDDLGEFPDEPAKDQ